MAKILLVDDEPDVAGLMSDWLRLRGYEVLRAGDGVEALRLARSDDPDLILLDAFMPGLDGLETGRRLRAQPETRHMPIVLIAGEDAAAAQVDRLIAGASDAVTRPVALEDLGARMKALLEGELPPEDHAGALARGAVASAVSSLPCRMAWLFAPDADGGWVSKAAAAPGHPEVIPARSAAIHIPPGETEWWPARSLLTRVAEFNVPLDDIQSTPDDPIIQACVRTGAGYLTLIPLDGAAGQPGLLLLASPEPLDMAGEAPRRALMGVTYQANLALGGEHTRAAPPSSQAHARPEPAPKPEAEEDQPSEDGEEVQAGSEDLRFEALREATLAALSAPGLDAALQTIINEAAKALGVKLTALLLRPERGGEALVFHRAAGLRAKRLEDIALPLAGSLTDDALKAREPVLFRRGQAKKVEVTLIEERIGQPVATAAAAPLIVQGETAGALLAVNRWDGPFGPADLDLLYSLANLASIAISGARLAVDFEGRARGLAVLGRAAEAVAAQPMPALLDSVTRLLTDGLAARWCTIRSLDGRTGNLVTLARRIDHRKPGKDARRVELSDWPAARQVIDTGAIIRMAANRQQGHGGAGMQSLLLYPVPIGGRAAGVAALGHPSLSLAFTEQHVARCRAVTDSWAERTAGSDWAASAGRLAESLLAAVGAPWCSVFTLDPDGKSLTLAAETGHVAFDSSNQETHRLDQDSLRRSALSTRMTIAATPDDERLSPADRAIGWPFSTGMAIMTPIMARGEAIGLIEVADDSPDRYYADHDRLVLRAIANLLGAVLGRASEPVQLQEMGLAPSSERVTSAMVMGYADLRLEESAATVSSPPPVERAQVDEALAAKPLRKAMASLENVARMAMHELQPAAEHADVLLASFFAEFLPDMYIDRERIFQVIAHLLDNAIKLSPEGSRVVLTIREADSMLQVEIADRGSGIPREEQAKIWDKSYRLAGRDLGLAAVRQIVEAHGGRVWVVSSPGQGSTFAFTLPKPEVSGMGDFIPSF